MMFAFLLAVLLSAAPQDQRPWVGVVNGDTLALDNFARDVGRRMELAASVGKADMADAVQAAWTDAVTQSIVKDEAQRRTIYVTDANVDSLLNSSPPDFVRRGFVDEKGRFDTRLLHGLLANPDSVVKASLGSSVSADRIQEEIDGLRASIQDLRNRLRTMMIEDRLRQQVLREEFSVDSARLREAFVRAAERCNVNLVLLPCASTVAEPDERQLQQYHASRPWEFTSTESLRRFAYIAFAMTPSASDSVRTLDNVRRFVRDINAERTERRRDSLWSAVSSVTRSFTTVLHPDSTTTNTIYAALKGAARGRAYGPIRDGADYVVVLVDSVSTVSRGRKVYLVRGIRTIVEAGKTTIDSVLTLVDSAATMYDSGEEFGSVAQKFKKTVELGPWVTPQQKVFGSYRLADVIHSTPRLVLCDPVDTPEKGVVVAVVVDSLPAGPLPFDAARDRVHEAYRRRQSCLDVRTEARRLAAVVKVLPEGTFFVGEKPANARILRSVTVDRNGFIGEELFDPAAVKEILKNTEPGLYGPFVGDLGWYMTHIISYEPAEPREFPLWLQLRGEDAVAEQQQEFWTSWLQRQRTTARIIDNRWLTFRY